MSDPDTDREQTRPLSLHEVVGSIMAALPGGQSSHNRARDLTRVTARQYIVAGLIATIVLVPLVYLGVKLIMRFAPG